jgi:hypothetical protein
LSILFHPELTGESPSPRSTVASSPPSFSSFPDPRSHFLKPCGCLWLDVIAGNRPCKPEWPAGASRSGRARHGRPWQAATASLVVTVSAIPSARMGISLSRSTPLDHVTPYLFVVHREHWPRQSALCAAAARCTWTGLSVAPPSLLSTSSSSSSLTDPFPSLYCHSGSPEMTEHDSLPPPSAMDDGEVAPVQ